VREGFRALSAAFQVPGALPSLRVVDLCQTLNLRDVGGQANVRLVADAIGRPGVLPALRGMYFVDEGWMEILWDLVRARPMVAFSRF
jgi:hypothetical protein